MINFGQDIQKPSWFSSLHPAAKAALILSPFILWILNRTKRVMYDDPALIKEHGLEEMALLSFTDQNDLTELEDEKDSVGEGNLSNEEALEKWKDVLKRLDTLIRLRLVRHVEKEEQLAKTHNIHIDPPLSVVLKRAREFQEELENDIKWLENEIRKEK